MMRMLFSSALACLALAACAGGDADHAPTYWDDVAPITQAKCAKCHQPGGIAPFALDSYAAVKGRSAAVAAATRTGVMPPYLLTHDGSCGEFDDAEALTPSEKDIIWEWANGERLEGTARSDRPRPAPASLQADSEWTTPSIVPVAQGGALAEVDEYRCFPLESGMAKESFITGYEVVPGEPALVHHVVVFLVDPDQMSEKGKPNRELMKELDAEDGDRIGWPCYSAAGEGVAIDGVPIVWAPGQGPVVYPGGLGVLQKPGQMLVVQMHYNLADPRVRGLVDATTVRMRHADEVARQGLFVTQDGFLDTLFEGQPESLPPRQKSVNFTWRSTLEEMGLQGLPHVDLVGVMPHMHERGVSKRLSIIGEDGARRCAANVDHWNFHWQKFYFYEGTLPRLTPKTQLEASCTYDTSDDVRPVMPGWGTRNEMCTAIMMMALPTGSR
jgi:hypothetical protein